MSVLPTIRPLRGSPLSQLVDCRVLPEAVLHLQDRPGWDQGEDRQPAPGGALSAGQHLYRNRRLPQRNLDNEAARRGRKGALRRPEAGGGRSLLASAGHIREGARGPVPSRRVQPVSVESVLDSQLKKELPVKGERYRSPFLFSRTIRN
jgi:hypothetical protein